jgi:hypothetical protein
MQHFMVEKSMPRIVFRGVGDVFPLPVTPNPTSLQSAPAG